MPGEVLSGEPQSEPDLQRLHPFLTLRRIEMRIQLRRLRTDMPNPFGNLRPINPPGHANRDERVTQAMPAGHQLEFCPRHQIIKHPARPFRPQSPDVATGSRPRTTPSAAVSKSVSVCPLPTDKCDPLGSDAWVASEKMWDAHPAYLGKSVGCGWQIRTRVRI